MGDSELHLAESVDLVNWNLTNNSANWNTWAKAIFTRENKLLESGPAPVKWPGMPINGYLFIMRLPQVVVTFQNAYTVNQMLVDYNDIRKDQLQD